MKNNLSTDKLEENNEEYYNEEQSAKIKESTSLFIKKMSVLWIVIVVCFVSVITTNIFRSFNYFDLLWLKYVMLAVNIIIFCFTIVAIIKAIKDYKYFKQQLENIENDDKK